MTEPIYQDECIGAWYAWLDDPGQEIDRRIMVVFDADPHDGGRSLSAGAGEGC